MPTSVRRSSAGRAPIVSGASFGAGDEGRSPGRDAPARGAGAAPAAPFGRVGPVVRER